MRAFAPNGASTYCIGRIGGRKKAKVNQSKKRKGEKKINKK
ncbi:MAG: hypothetical protein ACMUEL_05320 [Flavobacteriales bacterium Tduv]